MVHLLVYRLILSVRTTYHVFDNIYKAVINLPKPIRCVCFVQVFAFMGWYVVDTSSILVADHKHRFPFLFYSYDHFTYIIEYLLTLINIERPT